MLADVGKTELGPPLYWVVQGLQQPDHAVHSLIEFRKLGEATPCHDGAPNQTAQESHATTSSVIRSWPASSPSHKSESQSARILQAAPTDNTSSDQIPGMLPRHIPD